jgi:hypothetical protein
MKVRSFKRDEAGDILGIPMYLIIIMIVAVAVIASVIYMIPKGTRTMTAQVTTNALLAESSSGGGAFNFSNTYTIWVKVMTNDERADPIMGATVTLVGASEAAQAKTLTNGSAKITGVKPHLDANINEAHMVLTVKAAGYEDYSDPEAVTVIRLG